MNMHADVAAATGRRVVSGQSIYYALTVNLTGTVTAARNGLRRLLAN